MKKIAVKLMVGQMFAMLCLVMTSWGAQAQWIDHEGWHARDGEIDWSFEGFYIGGSFAFGRGRVDVTGSAGTTGELEPGGGMAGVFFGVNHRHSSSLILGLETGVDFGSYDDTSASLGRLEYGSIWTTRGIIGTEIAADKMLYGALGLVGAGVEYNNPLTGGEDVSWLWGLHLGVGVEQYVRDEMRVRLEYTYNRFENWDFVDGSEQFSGRPSVHAIRLGVSLALDPEGF